MLVFGALLSCDTERECVNLDDFTDMWWEIQESKHLISRCYFFSSDGYIIESDNETDWIAGDWVSDTCESDCSIMIESDDHDLHLLGYTDGCWDVNYDGLNVTACECSYDM